MVWDSVGIPQSTIREFIALSMHVGQYFSHLLASDIGHFEDGDEKILMNFSCPLHFVIEVRRVNVQMCKIDRMLNWNWVRDEEMKKDGMSKGEA